MDWSDAEEGERPWGQSDDTILNLEIGIKIHKIQLDLKGILVI